jgi:hypothetical protein
LFKDKIKTWLGISRPPQQYKGIMSTSQPPQSNGYTGGLVVNNVVVNGQLFGYPSGSAIGFDMSYNTIVGDDVLKQFPSLAVLTPLLVDNKAYVAGGCFKNLLTGEPCKDIDVFFVNDDAFHEYVEKFRRSAVYEEAYSTHRSVGFRHKGNGTIIDLVSYRIGQPLDTIKSFDFTIVKFAYAMIDGIPTVYQHVLFDHDLDLKRLEIDHVTNPDKLFNRIIRYTRYGYKVTTQTKRLLFDSISAGAEWTVSPTDSKY